MTGASDKSDRAFVPAASSQQAVSPVPASIPCATKSLRLPITPELDAAATGEIILSYINEKERWGYSTREFVRGGFREVDELAPLDARTLCCGCWANTPGEGDTVGWWRSEELGLDVFLHWDGDGTIVFKHADWTLENGDCKNDHDWEWVLPGHWSINYPRYEDAAQAIEARRAETQRGSVADESAVGTADAPNPRPAP